MAKGKALIKREDHAQIIDEYFNNGFNGVQAVLSVYPDKPYQQAKNLASAVLNKESNKGYIQAKQNDLGRGATVQASQIINELKQQAFADLRHYIGLSPEDIAQLPPELTRPLKKIRVKERTYRNKDGSEVQDKEISYELEDRQKALDMLGKYIGLYEADNRQRGHQINLNQLNIGQLNTLLEAIAPPPEGT